MHLKELDHLELPASADMHVHLRQGKLMDLIVPQIRRGGVDTQKYIVCVCDAQPSTPNYNSRSSDYISISTASH